MRRLIDAETFLARVVEANPMGGMIGGKFIEDLIKAMPTAYDVEKTIKQLEELKDCHYIHLVNARVVVRDAIEIVKGGGKDA